MPPSHLRGQVYSVRMVVRPCGATRQHLWKVRLFWCEDNNADLMRVQPHYYRVQVQSYHRLGEVTRRSS